MGTLGWVVAAAVAFVGTHFLLSHPLRAAIVARIGEAGFLVLYSVVALVTIVWLALAYRAAPMTPMLWPVGDGIWAVVTIVMLLASVLLMGSLIGNPALPDPTGGTRPPDEATGVFAITRHPMMWSFALWGACHIAVYPVAANIVVAIAIIVLALVGAAMQDRKKEALTPERWRAWEVRTSYWPFAAMAKGRARSGRCGCTPLGAAWWSGSPRPGRTCRSRDGRRGYGVGFDRRLGAPSSRHKMFRMTFSREGGSPVWVPACAGTQSRPYNRVIAIAFSP